MCVRWFCEARAQLCASVAPSGRRLQVCVGICSGFVKHVGTLWSTGDGAVVREGGAELLAAIGAFFVTFCALCDT